MPLESKIKKRGVSEQSERPETTAAALLNAEKASQASIFPSDTQVRRRVLPKQHVVLDSGTTVSINENGVVLIDDGHEVRKAYVKRPHRSSMQPPKLAVNLETGDLGNSTPAIRQNNRAKDQMTVAVRSQRTWTCALCRGSLTAEEFRLPPNPNGRFGGKCKVCEAKSRAEIATTVRERLAMRPRKRCTKCGAFKLMYAFYNRKGAWDGKQTWCKSCLKVAVRRCQRVGTAYGAKVAADPKVALPPDEKNCSKCGQDRDRSEFYVNRTAPDGLQSWCRDCMLKVVQEHRRKYGKNVRKRRGISEKKRALIYGMTHQEEFAEACARGKTLIPPVDYIVPEEYLTAKVCRKLRY